MYHHQISQDHPENKIFFQDTKAGSNINFQKSLKIAWAATRVV